jgi:DNA invertase Pin-like site-specific DNA recombinase
MPARCAIYTRKSTDEGLEQEFNSLNAQRESCEAYIASQRAEGWVALKESYDDGGYSGGTLERPALQRLLRDIEGGNVDVVVVYKIDRLSRSLLDFAKLVEAFDRKNVTFVSVTQSFNTTTSMGRLTLNVLLSFAQFEREVAGERIRDKIAASKKRGIWMGGTVPLGYDVVSRKLVVSEAEAETVRLIFRRYLELGSVRVLRDELAGRGIVSKLRASRNGVRHGGRPYDRGALTHILKNRIYLGQTTHKGSAYPGEHKPIVPRELFDAVQAQIAAGRHENRRPTNQSSQAKLAGLVFDDNGCPMRPTYARKPDGREYHYYASDIGPNVRPTTSGLITRVPVASIEALVEQCLRRFDLDGLCEEERSYADTRATHAHGQRLNIALYIRRIDVKAQTVVLRLDRRIALDRWRENDELMPAPSDAELLAKRTALTGPGEQLIEKGDQLNLTLPVRAKFRGGRGQVLAANGCVATNETCANPSLLKALGRAHAWISMLLQGKAQSIEDLARQASKHRGDIAPILRLAFLSPSMTQAILEGRQPSDLTLSKFLEMDIPLSWAKQAELLTFNQSGRRFDPIRAHE